VVATADDGASLAPTDYEVEERIPEQFLLEPLDSSVIPPLDIADTYESKSDAIGALENFGRCNGFAVVIGTSKSKVCRSGTYERLRMVCDRSKTPEVSKNEFVRRSSSKRCGCPFEVIVSKKCEDTSWHVKVINDEHNHEASLGPSDHASLRRKDRQHYISAIEAGIATGRRLQSIVTDIRYRRNDHKDNKSQKGRPFGFVCSCLSF